jgi:hypothetical protein
VTRQRDSGCNFQGKNVQRPDLPLRPLRGRNPPTPITALAGIGWHGRTSPYWLLAGWRWLGRPLGGGNRGRWSRLDLHQRHVASDRSRIGLGRSGRPEHLDDGTAHRRIVWSWSPGPSPSAVGAPRGFDWICQLIVHWRGLMTLPGGAPASLLVLRNSAASSSRSGPVGPHTTWHWR